MKEIIFLVLALGLLSTPVFVRFVDTVARTGQICVRSDGLVDPETAYIQRIGNIYTLRAHILAHVK